VREREREKEIDKWNGTLPPHEVLLLLRQVYCCEDMGMGRSMDVDVEMA